jgi:hypothetical protein
MACYLFVMLCDVAAGLGNVKQLHREFDPELRVRQFQEDEALRARNAAAKAAGANTTVAYSIMMCVCCAG